MPLVTYPVDLRCEATVYAHPLGLAVNVTISLRRLLSEGHIGSITINCRKGPLCRTSSVSILSMGVSSGSNPVDRHRLDTVPKTRRAAVPTGPVGLVVVVWAPVILSPLTIPLRAPWGLVAGMGATTPPTLRFFLSLRMSLDDAQPSEAIMDMRTRVAVHAPVKPSPSQSALLLPTLSALRWMGTGRGLRHRSGCICRAWGFGADGSTI